MKSALRIAISLALAGLFLYWAFSGIDLSLVWDAARNADGFWLGIIVVTTLCTVAIRAWRWIILLRGVTTSVTVSDATTALAICYTANLVLPRAGEAARAMSLQWQRGVSVSAALGTVVIERIIDMVCLLFLVGLSLALLGPRLENEYPGLTNGSLIMLALCVGASAVLVYVVARGESGILLVHRILARLLPDSLADTATGMLRRFVSGLASIRGHGAYLKILVSSVVLNAGYILLIYESILAFGLDRAPHELGAAASLVVMTISSIGVVIPVQGGVGTYHFFFANTLEVLYGVEASTALACATVVHALANLTYVVIGVPALLLQRVRRARG